MRSLSVLGIGWVLLLVASCGGGGGSSSSSSSGGNPPPVRSLFVATQPVGAQASAAFATQPVIHLRSNGVTDAADNTTVISVSILSGTGASGAALTGTISVTVVAGVATFANLGINTAGTGYQLQFSATGLTPAPSTAFNVTAPPVRTLSVTTQPQGAVPSIAFATQPVIQVRSNGALDTSDNATVVTAAIVAGTGASGATLGGTTTATAIGGVATFANLAVSTAGTGYQLRFTATGVTEITSGTFSVTMPGAVIPPSTPPASNVSFAIDSTQDVRGISRFIYGINFLDPAQARPANLTLSRSGGNRNTAYNWETNDSNAGADYQNQNDDFMGGGTTPNGAIAPMIARARAANAGIIVTVPTIGYVAADHNGGGDVNQTPNYIAVRFKQGKPRKNSPFSLTPDTTDAFVYQDEYVNFLDKTYPGAFGASTNPIFLCMDNEVDIWSSTHARLRGDAVTQSGTGIGYAEVVQLNRDYSNAAKAVNPNVIVFGPVNYGWNGFVSLQNAPDANNRDFLDFFLQQMAQAEVADGHRVLDVLDIHWYPEAQGGGVRITGTETTAAIVAARKQAPRSLWDPSYTETSWITGCCSGGPIRLLPRIKDKIAANYPNTRLAITEYNYGAGQDISGGIAQADVLGVFGREGLFAATLWPLSNSNDFLYGAFDMFRNYDGSNGSFGNTSIRATNTDVAAASVYASVDGGNASRMVLVAINKNDTAQSAGIAVTHTAQFHTAQVYVLTSANSVPQRVMPDINITLTNAFQYSMPANSVTTLVLLP
ncbi:MAG: glycoside hydrolase family 44 protein [Pseudomonadota bacterium]